MKIHFDWISSKDKLPPKNKHVVVYYKIQQEEVQGYKYKAEELLIGKFPAPYVDDYIELTQGRIGNLENQDMYYFLGSPIQFTQAKTVKWGGSRVSYNVPKDFYWAYQELNYNKPHLGYII